MSTVPPPKRGRHPRTPRRATILLGAALLTAAAVAGPATSAKAAGERVDALRTVKADNPGITPMLAYARQSGPRRPPSPVRFGP